MAVNHEIKSQLAKLLATEDLVVEHKKVETACFNVHTRVLTLPMWEKASSTVYDLLVGHEVGHALYTPDEDWLETVKVPPQFVNIVEDARIEKLMKRRFPGLSKSFYNGYKELNDEDFFSISGEDIGSFNMADRVNIWFKLGNFVNVPIERGEETELINMIAETETFADVLIAAEELYKYCKRKHQEETKVNIDDLETQNTSSSSSGLIESDFEEGESEGDGEESENGEVKEETTNTGGESNDVEVKTADSLAESLKDLVNESGLDNVYLELPKVELRKIIVSNSEVHQRCKETWENQNSIHSYEDMFYHVDSEFANFKKSSQKEVNYLVKEFECKKSADSYARSATSRTGVLDCAKLYTYKYNEDLFKKVTTLADGKNHGLVFLLDWSGSMSDVMTDTIKQLCNLVWFCKKVSIPFEVYAFTNDYPLVSYDEEGKATLRELAYKKRDGLVQVGEWFTLMNVLTSKNNGKVLEEQMKNLYRLSCAFRYNYFTKYQIPIGLNLSGTPLNEALITMNQILPMFQKENKLQKVQCVVLTDGEAAPPKYHREVQRRWEDEPYVGTACIGYNAFLRDRKTGNTYSLDGEWYEFTNTLIRMLRDSHKDVNFIGIRILAPRDAGTFVRRYCGYFGELYERTMSDWKKNKSFSIKSSGYHTYFGLSSAALSTDSEFEVAEDATKSQIKSAFVKSLRGKKMNKKVLGEFIELIV